MGSTRQMPATASSPRMIPAIRVSSIPMMAVSTISTVPLPSMEMYFDEIKDFSNFFIPHPGSEKGR